jgi:hypothetical protein
VTQVADALQQAPFPENIERYARRFSSMEEVWENCPRADWMLWMIENLGVGSRRALRLFICKCARRWWHFLLDPRSQRGLDAAERMANGQIARAAADYIRETSQKAATEAAASSKPIMGRAARLVVLALEEDVLPAAKEASVIASQAEHAINETMSEEHEMQILFQQAQDLRALMGNPFRTGERMDGAV